MRSGLVILLTLGLAMPAAARERSTLTREDARQAAESVLAKFDAAYGKHDAAGIAALYMANATFLPARPSPALGSVIPGRPGIEKFFADAFKTFGSQSGNLVDAGPLGNRAVWFVADLHLTGKDGNGPMRLDGHVGGGCLSAAAAPGNST